MVASAVQERVEEFWQSYKVRHVLEILGAFTEMREGLGSGLSKQEEAKVHFHWPFSLFV